MARWAKNRALRPIEIGFAREFIANGGNAKEAFLAAHPRPHTLRPNTAKRSGFWYLHQNARVGRYIKKRLDRMIKKGEITEDAILSKYESAFKLAESQEDPANMVSAAREQAKLVGLLKDRIETSNRGAFEGCATPADVIERLAEHIGPDLALRVGRAIGILGPTAQEQMQEQAADLLQADSPSQELN